MPVHGEFPWEIPSYTLGELAVLHISVWKHRHIDKEKAEIIRTSKSSSWNAGGVSWILQFTEKWVVTELT